MRDRICSDTPCSRRSDPHTYRDQVVKIQLARKLGLERRCHHQGREDDIQQAHRRAAHYWQWRVEVWPQDRHAAVQDSLEARHHLLATGDIDQAAALTEHVCSQLDTWGPWDHESTLIHDTLTRLAPDSPRRPVWLGQLGNLAYRRGDYEEAEQCYQQALPILERLGDQSGMAGSYHQLGMLAQDRGDYEGAERRYQQALRIDERLGHQSGVAAGCSQLGNLNEATQRHAEAIFWHIRALLVRGRLQVPQIVIDAHALIRLRAQLGNEAFVTAAKNVLGDAEIAELQTQLNAFRAAESSSEPEDR